MSMHRRFFVFCAAAAAAAAWLVPASAQQNPYLGRWNLIGTGDNSGSVYWIEIREEGGQLTGNFLNRSSSPFKLHSVRVENGELIWEPIRNVKTPDTPGPQFHAKAEGGKLVGFVKMGERTLTFEGVRPHKWPAMNANGKHTYGKPVELFDGKSLDGWDVQNPKRPMKWTVADGAMTNDVPGANNLVSKEKFKDFKVQAEYKLDKDSNSGIYVRGRYELQVLDDFGKPTESHGHMSIYGWTAPLVNASKPAGEWQTMEAVVVGNKVTVTLNGQKVHDNATLEAITGGALDANETEAGPIMLQGDHGKVWYRKVTVTPIIKVGS
jgi:3-keto-disaccharide hydrolase